MKVIGIDPDTNNTGWALLEETSKGVVVLECGVIDTRSTKGILAVERTIRGLYRVLPKLLACHGVIAEYPQSYNVGGHYGGGRTSKVDPNSLIMLAAISGAALAAANVAPRGFRALVRPMVWKGQQTKGANQRQTARIIGWKFENHSSCYTSALVDVTPPKEVKVHPWKGKSRKPWSEILDAAGIALYGLGKYRKEGHDDG